MVRRGFMAAPRPGPPGARPGCGARRPLCPPLPRVWCRAPGGPPCGPPGAPWLSRPPPGGRRATWGRASPAPLRAAWCPDGLVGRADGPVPRPTAGDVGAAGHCTPGRKGKMNGPPIGPGGRPCPRGWVRWRGAVLPWAVGRGARAPVLLPWWFRPGDALAARLWLVPPGDSTTRGLCQGSR